MAIERDELAAQIFVAYCANPNICDIDSSDEKLAHWAFNAAESFITERRKRNKAEGEVV